MTARQLYNYALVELNKEQAPSLLLEDYNYFINKAISLYINLGYNIYDSNLQSSDSLRVLKATLPVKPQKVSNDLYGGFGSNYENIWEVELPQDYYHILNCMVTFYVKKKYDCYDEGTYTEFPARRLTSDMWSQVINNAYMKPSYRRPYYFIHNVNLMSKDGTYTLPTNPETDPTVTSVDENPKQINLSGLARSLYASKYNNEVLSDDKVLKLPAHRYGNASPVRLEIRYGKDDTVFEPYMLRIDYLKTPQHIRLTQEQLDRTEDTSQIMEFPDYVCQEIINGLVKLIMENASDPRLQSNLAINLTIAQPGQQLTQK